VNAIRADGLHIRAGGKHLLEDLSVEFGTGELVGLIGPNGAGKSTLLRALAGFWPPDSGEVYWHGRPLRHYSPAERGALGGYLPQHASLAWDYSVRELVDLGAGRARTSGQAVRDAIEAHGLGDLLDRRWSTLSGGERARSMLASVMVSSPCLLMADEPGASLDVRHRLELLERLRLASSESAVIVVLHDIELAARFCGRLILMDKGRIVCDGPASQVVAGDVLDHTFGVRFQRVPVQNGYDTVLGITTVRSERQAWR
jgi:iron complex transport system ATP-binding protein